MKQLLETLVALLALAGVLHAQSRDAKDKKDEANERKAKPEAGSSVAEILKRYDKDGDGRLARTEMRLKKVTFDALDVDQNGYLGKGEIAALAGRAGGMYEIVPLSQRAEVVDLAEFDADRDGSIVEKELRAYVFALADQNEDGSIDAGEVEPLAAFGRFAAELGSDGKALLQRLDRNRDDALSDAEFKLAAREIEDRDQNGDGKLGPDEIEKRLDGGLSAYASQDADSVIERFDGNKDGALSTGELPGGAKGILGRLDRDQDGKVSREELDRALKYAQTTQFAAVDPSFLERYDLDGDGKVARAEFPGSDAVFQRLDRDGDGAVTRADG